MKKIDKAAGKRYVSSWKILAEDWGDGNMLS